ncbi:RNA polymerase beta subunit [Erwinia phage vB_EamM_Deimos-Minion]|uniref:DNA-directed RNA polymerase beta n=1 Tax=Erwinia phage vB_EamM_Deimos-Minion TaxID=1815986 RepID=A0A173GFN9_9CAUD|nr:RNA polymerase beta subunit [Erwinia phage vB_EamM_Deimos-Minion]ANH52375.1 DNA-directed RNA polymerase beta [Erwinia phage vB_EamM_Deimos-Minion]
MNIRDYLIMAFRAGAYKQRQWVLSVMSITQTPDGKSVADSMIPYQAHRINIGATLDWAYWDDFNKTFVPIEGVDVNFPLFRPEDQYTLQPGDFANVTEEVTTTFGRILANHYYFIDVVGERVPFQNVEFNRGMLEKIYKARVLEDAQDLRRSDPFYLTVDEFKRSVDNGFALGGLSKLCVPTACPETMYPPKFIIEMRDRLFEEHKDELNNPVVMGRIQDELLKHYREFLMSTPSAKFFVIKKTIDQAFNNMFLTGGIAGAFGGNTVITNSLYEGWNLKNFPALVNGSIEASFDRGAATADGGEKVKMLIRATQNIRITDDDCGTQLGVPWVIEDAGKARFINSYILDKGVTILLTPENIDKFIGKPVMTRSPSFCKKSHGDSCKFCVGAHNATNPRGMSSGTSKIGSTLMLLSMKAMHKGSKIDLIEYNLDEVFN